jgi:hypothetical protein
MKFVARIRDSIVYPFVSFAVMLDESRRNNENGEWNDYWARKNCNAELRELRAEYKAKKSAIKEKWMVTITRN